MILSALRDAELSGITPNLRSLSLSQGDILEEPGERIGSVFFVESGILSLVAVAPGGINVEAGLIGREGLTGTGLLERDWHTPFRHVVQIGGAARRIKNQCR